MKSNREIQDLNNTPQPDNRQRPRLILTGACLLSLVLLLSTTEMRALIKVQIFRLCPTSSRIGFLKWAFKAESSSQKLALEVLRQQEKLSEQNNNETDQAIRAAECLILRLSLHDLRRALPSYLEIIAAQGGEGTDLNFKSIRPIAHCLAAPDFGPALGDELLRLSASPRLSVEARAQAVAFLIYRDDPIPWDQLIPEAARQAPIFDALLDLVLFRSTPGLVSQLIHAMLRENHSWTPAQWTSLIEILRGRLSGEELWSVCAALTEHSVSYPELAGVATRLLAWHLDSPYGFATIHPLNSSWPILAVRRMVIDQDLRQRALNQRWDSFDAFPKPTFIKDYRPALVMAEDRAPIAVLLHSGCCDEKLNPLLHHLTNDVETGQGGSAAYAARLHLAALIVLARETLTATAEPFPSGLELMALATKRHNQLGENQSSWQAPPESGSTSQRSLLALMDFYREGIPDSVPRTVEGLNLYFKTRPKPDTEAKLFRDNE